MGKGRRRKVAVSEGTHRSLMFLTAGRHTRLPAVARLRSACLTTLIALVVEFGLGMWLNIYVPVPAADQHAGIVREIANGPLLLTTHILVGVFLIGAAIVLLIRAVNVRHTKITALASVTLAAVIGAFGAGDFFARDGESRTSFWMALLTGVALLCCIYVQALTVSADMAPAGARSGSPPVPSRVPSAVPSPRPEPGPAARAPYRRAAAVPPQPGYGRGAPAYREAGLEERQLSGGAVVLRLSVSGVSLERLRARRSDTDPMRGSRIQGFPEGYGRRPPAARCGSRRSRSWLRPASAIRPYPRPGC